MTQQDQILAELLNGETLTGLGILRKIGCFRLAAVVHRLREEGYPIETITMSDGKKHWAGYRIIRDDAGAIQMRMFA